MKLLSIDIGIKNLAYCVIEVLEKNKFNILAWDIVNLCNPVKQCNCIITKKNKTSVCNKQSKYFKDNNYFCQVCAKKSVFQLPCKELSILEKKTNTLASLCTLANKYDIDPNKYSNKAALKKYLIDYKTKHILQYNSKDKANDLDLVSAGCKINENLNKLKQIHEVDMIIIENQISPLAGRMKTLQGMITQYFIMKNITNIKFVSASQKLKPFILKKKTTYSERKSLSIKACLQFLQQEKKKEYIKKITESKKKDDLADTFLQGIVFLQTNHFIDCKFNYLT